MSPCPLNILCICSFALPLKKEFLLFSNKTNYKTRRIATCSLKLTFFKTNLDGQ